MEVFFAKNNPQEWPSLFSNLIEPRIKDISAASKFYHSHTDEKIQLRLAIRKWESGAWSLYESLMGCSLQPMSKSIDSRLWAKKEILSIELLLKEGKNQLMTSCDNFCLEIIPELYNHLITGDWENFILIEEGKRYEEAYSEYLKDNEIDPFDERSIIDCVDFNTFFARPQEEYFLINRAYFAAKEIQALLWYKEFLVEIMHIGITFYEEQDYGNDQKKSERKFIDIINLQRSNDGYEAIRASADDFFVANDRVPKWSELMDYMAKQPPHGFTVKALFKGQKVSELTIEGEDKPIDREAFRKRCERYFKKTDIKPDNNELFRT
jgi:hypothetical protein